MTTKGYVITTHVYGPTMPRYVAASNSGRAKSIVINLIKDLGYESDYRDIASCRRYPGIDGQAEGFRDCAAAMSPSDAPGGGAG